MEELLKPEAVLNGLRAVFLLADNDTVLVTRMAHLLVILGVANALNSLLTSTPAPYGRYSEPVPGQSPPTTVNPTLGWIIQECPSFLFPAAILFFGSCHTPVTNLILLAPFMFHYFHRSFVYPLYLLNSKRSLLSIVIAATFFCTYNGFMQGYHLLCLARFDDNHLLSVEFLIGVFVFCFGFAINVHSDYTLLHLRKPGETGYKIPRGGMFEYVSCANYFGEILEWWGFCVATWSYPSFAFAVFTTLNLAPRAVFHHRFYLQKMDDYPKNRKAVIPFIV